MALGFQTPRDLTKLKREWDARLRANGFVDIEYGDGSIRSAIIRPGKTHRPLEHLEYEARCEYYSRAAEILHRYPWPTALARSVWGMHVEGATLRDISKAHGKSGPKWAHDAVHAIERETLLWWTGTHRHVRRWEDGGDEELAKLRAEVRFYKVRRAVAAYGQLALPFGETSARG